MTFLIFVLFSGISFSILVVNTTETVCAVGDNYFSTIQRAIDDPGASDNGTIIVCNDAAYRENVVINKSINLQGNESGVIIGASNSALPTVNITMSFVNITNFTVMNSSDDSSVLTAGVWAENVSNVSICNMTAVNNTYGFYIYHSNYSNVTNNTIYNNSWRGIMVVTSHNNTISNNSIYLNYQDGIAIFTLSQTNTITRNLAFSNGHADDVYAYNGILIYNVSNTTISNNSAYNNSDLGVYLHHAEDNNISRIIVYNNSLGGFYAIFAHRNNITESNISNNSYYGIYFNSSNYNIVNNTNATKNADYGIRLAGCNYSHINSSNTSNNSIGLYIDTSLYSNFTFINSTKNLEYGIYIYVSNYNRINGSNASNNSYGIYMANSLYNNITNSTTQENTDADFVNLAEFGSYSGNAETSYCNNLVADINGSGGNPVNYTNETVNWANFVAAEVFFCNADNSNLTSVTITGSSRKNNGIIMYLSDNLTVTNSNSSNAYYGMLVYASSDNNITNNIIENSNDIGIVIFNSSRNRFTNNTILGYDGTSTGIFSYLENLSNYTDNRIHNNTLGTWFFISPNITISLNNITNNTLANIYVTYSSGGANITENIVYNGIYGIYLYDATESSITSNNVTSAIISGVAIINTSIEDFSNNRINNSLYGIGVSEGNVTFSGNNYIYSPLTDGFEVYLGTSATSRLSTGDYNISTDYLDFAIVNATNVSIRTVNLTSSVINTTAVNSITDVSDLRAAKIVQSAQGDYYGLNVTNTTESASFQAKMYFNNSDTTGYSVLYLGIGRYDSTDGWRYQSAAIDFSLGSITASGAVTSFSYFAPLIYALEEANPGTDANKKTPLINYEFNCSDGKLEIELTHDDTNISNVIVQLFRHATPFRELIGKKTTDGTGKATFDINENGFYEIETVASGSYRMATLGLFELTLCRLEQTPAGEGTVESNEILNQSEINQEETPEYDAELEAELAMERARNAIEEARTQQKDTDEAEAKLADALKAFEHGYYLEATNLADDAYQLALNAQQLPIIEEEQTGEQQTEQEQLREEENEVHTDNSVLFIALVVLGLIIAVGVAGYYYFMRKKRR